MKKAPRNREKPKIALAVLLAASALIAAPSAPILEYIRQTWQVLTRTNRNLAAAAADPKFHKGAGGRWPVYIAGGENAAVIEKQLQMEMSPADFHKIQILRLPVLNKIREPGLLYLPKPYVVPGGRFNEMYGWDSYFIQAGLLRDGYVGLAQDMADNFLYEIHNFGKILNANRSYYLTRSQPPFLTEMLLDVYLRTHDHKWLENALPAVDEYYRYWTTDPHLTPQTGLSRYYDLGDGPAPEVLASERNNQGPTHYDLARAYFRTHNIQDFNARQYYDQEKGQLTPLFYKGDRSMRESGFDPSDRFGPFNVDIIHYNPVCLNSLLYVMEAQTAEILEIANRMPEASVWRKRAQDRAAKINRLLWDARDGLYYDYQFVANQRRRYPFLTTFYPLWAGIASKEQAARVAKNLPMFERAGGLQTSTTVSGDQWDAPFGWAPLQMIAVQGLRRYGYQKEANRISREFLSLVIQEFQKQGTLVEKYDVVHRTSDLRNKIEFGYRSNEAGFGWTNAVFTALLDELPPAERSALLGSAP